MTQAIKLTLLLVFLGTSVANLTSDGLGNTEYEEWKALHGKDYDEHEDRYRAFLFQQKMEEVKAHNENTENTYQKGANRFSAQTHEQLLLKYTGATPPKQQKVSASVQYHKNVRGAQTNTTANINTINATANYTLINWTALNKVNAPRDQGTCGGCWAFSTVDTIQSAYLIKNKLNATNSKDGKVTTTLTLSVQQLIDCAYHLADGCQGGWMDQAMDYAIILGLTTEQKYPYTSRTSGKWSGACLKDGGATKIKKFTTISTKNDCEELMPYIYKGPLVTPVFATKHMFDYIGGIFRCNKTEVPESYSVNHAVVVTGIADSDGTFIIKQSWGSSFGENGYMKLDRIQSCNLCSNSQGFLPQL